MGKGDRRTRKGKTFSSSYGNVRPKASKKKGSSSSKKVGGKSSSK